MYDAFRDKLVAGMIERNYDPDFAERNIIVDQLVELNKDTVDELAELGL